MKFNTFLFPALAALSIGPGAATPVPCPDETRDLILSGKLSPEACCPYGVCRGEVVVRMY
ncbi:uncharacterized protein DNG_05002 [Cephalotrichum gorgonifer]|uniref:Uncharacterized protein n=1 Tax=Cephalotrichum gorgonifer TaxID=2041049 RepID=A0AAE8MYZ2_9PEZI|nr:uncharacterized protein DNG_05002 [Cephalotrichum gorgonifer]